MSPVLNQSRPKGNARTVVPNALPAALNYRPGQPAMVTFADGRVAHSTCLRCHNTPCITLAPEETALSAFPDFPADRRDTVCASDAIKRDPQSGAPIIDNTRCVLCGLCAFRCPVGAIYMTLGQGALLQDTPNALFIDTEADVAQTSLANATLFKNVPRTGILLVESQPVLHNLHTRLAAAVRTAGDNFPNVLARNLLIAVGIGTAMRRKGGNFMRMDLILGPPGVETGLAEVEFGDEAILDAPRDVMDAVAVLVSRYGWEKKNIVAAIVGDIMPNRRSEYLAYHSGHQPGARHQDRNNFSPLANASRLEPHPHPPHHPKPLLRRLRHTVVPHRNLGSQSRPPAHAAAHAASSG